MNRTCKQSLRVAVMLALACSGCASMGKTSTGTALVGPAGQSAPIDQQGVLNAAFVKETVNDVSYAVIAVCVVALLANLMALLDKLLLAWQSWLSHRREVIRLEKNGAESKCSL